MFAVVKSGGKQYRLSEGDVLLVEKLGVDPGSEVVIDEVLMVGGETPAVGEPLVDGASVTAEVIEQVKGPKVVSFKKRRRKHSSQRRRGHRQALTRLRVTGIRGAPGDVTAD